MRRRILHVACLLLAIPALIGCGSDGDAARPAPTHGRTDAQVEPDAAPAAEPRAKGAERLTIADLRLRADDTCYRANVETVSHTMEARSTQEMLAGVIVRERLALRELRRLSPPARSADRYAGLLATLSRRDALTRRWQMLLRRGASLARVVDGRNRLTYRANRGAARLGLVKCPYF